MVFGDRATLGNSYMVNWFTPARPKKVSLGSTLRLIDQTRPGSSKSFDFKAIRRNSCPGRSAGNINWNVVLLKIDVIVSATPRGWHQRLIDRLDRAGHDIAIGQLAMIDSWPASANLALALERRLLHRNAALTAPASIVPRAANRAPDLRLDLTGEVEPNGTPTIRVAFDGHFSDAAMLSNLAAGRLPDVEIVLDGKLFERAAPMVDNRIFVAAAIDDVLTRTITAILAALARYDRGERDTTPFLSISSHVPFGMTYLTAALPRIVREIVRRGRYHYAHWRVGYRLLDGPGVAEAATLGTGWNVLPDDGTRFYADPFAFEHKGARYIFVEDYPHATRKAVISVSTLDAAGNASPPAPVLEEPHHLSYPQVFTHGGEIWMLPEGSGSGRLTLYRATHFPDRWEPVATLLEGEISDATLLEHNGRFWLFATERDGGGSTSDTLVVFHAPALTGPWTPHRQNPILIDRRGARPGGAIIERDGALVLPVQDGTLGYGGGLGLSTILRLDDEALELGEAHSVSGMGDFPYPQIHTLNRAGRLEVIDGIAAVRKR
jgi:hypothetical protein